MDRNDCSADDLSDIALREVSRKASPACLFPHPTPLHQQSLYTYQGKVITVMYSFFFDFFFFFEKFCRPQSEKKKGGKSTF